MRILFIFLLTTWTLFSWWYYTCKIKQTCIGSSFSSATTIPETEKSKPLLFRWSSYQIPLDSGFPALKEKILSQQNGQPFLKITGHYFMEEVAPNASFDLGIARASEVKQLLLDDLLEDDVFIYSVLLPDSELSADSLIEGIQFEWIEQSPNDSEEIDTPEDTSELEEPSDKEETSPINESPIDAEVADNDYFVKYFPYNQTRIPTQLSSFLDDLAVRVIQEDKKVIIRGHTDSVGDKETNFKVGLRRAKKVRDQLKERGVPRKNIETTSAGEDQPIADNKTEEGRKQNRRIEIFLE